MLLLKSIGHHSIESVIIRMNITDNRGSGHTMLGYIAQKADGDKINLKGIILSPVEITSLNRLV